MPLILKKVVLGSMFGFLSKDTHWDSGYFHVKMPLVLKKVVLGSMFGFLSKDTPKLVREEGRKKGARKELLAPPRFC
jgi:hypothetical protein